MYYQVSESDLRVALQFWSPGQELDLCIMRRDHIPYLRHNVIELAGQPDRIIDTSLFYNRVPIKMYCMDSDEDIPSGTFYIDINYDDYIMNYGYDIARADKILEDATKLMADGILINIDQAIQLSA